MAAMSNTVPAHVVSAAALSEDQQWQLEQILSRKLDDVVKMTYEVDPSLLGGFTIHVGGYVIDRSIRKKLRELREILVRSGSE